MKEKLLVALNVALFALTLLVLATLQTSLWYQIMGSIPGPVLWLPCILYLALNRSALEAVLMIYLSSMILSTMTAMPDGLLLLVCLCLGLTAQIVRQRIQWPGPTYFMMICGTGVLLFHLFHWSASFALEDVPLSRPEIGDWILEALLTPLPAPLLLQFFKWLDRITARDQMTLAEGAESI